MNSLRKTADVIGRADSAQIFLLAFLKPGRLLFAVRNERLSAWPIPAARVLIPNEAQHGSAFFNAI
jgi:hypothetical protein